MSCFHSHGKGGMDIEYGVHLVGIPVQGPEARITQRNPLMFAEKHGASESEITGGALQLARQASGVHGEGGQGGELTARFA